MSHVQKEMGISEILQKHFLEEHLDKHCCCCCNCCFL